jgi:hypothetical protein
VSFIPCHRAEGLRHGDDLCHYPLLSWDLRRGGDLWHALLLCWETARTGTKLCGIDHSLLYKMWRCAADVIVKQRFTKTDVRGWTPLWNHGDLWSASPTLVLGGLAVICHMLVHSGLQLVELVGSAKWTALSHIECKFNVKSLQQFHFVEFYNALCPCIQLCMPSLRQLMTATSCGRVPTGYLLKWFCNISFGTATTTRSGRGVLLIGGTKALHAWGVSIEGTRWTWWFTWFRPLKRNTLRLW